MDEIKCISIHRKMMRTNLSNDVYSWEVQLLFFGLPPRSVLMPLWRGGGGSVRRSSSRTKARKREEERSSLSLFHGKNPRDSYRVLVAEQRDERQRVGTSEAERKRAITKIPKKCAHIHGTLPPFYQIKNVSVGNQREMYSLEPTKILPIDRVEINLFALT